MAQRTETFQICSTATANSAGVSYLDMPSGGTIVGVNFHVAGVAGAATTGYGHLSVSRNAVDGFNTNGVRGEIAACNWNASINAGSFSNNAYSAVQAVSVKPGERIYLNLALGGQAPSSCYSRVQLIVV